MSVVFFWHWLQFNYTGGPGEPFYRAATWPNVFVIAIVAPLGYLWSKTKFWPLRPLKHVLSHVVHASRMIEEIHHLAHTGEEHPRVAARRIAGESLTPKLDSKAHNPTSGGSA